MEYKIEKWQIKRLLKTLSDGNLDLNPPYQRNAIWTKKTQQFLVNSIKEGVPVPSIFLYEKAPGKYEMVDGQQRTRAIHLYNSTDEINFLDDDNHFKKGSFLKYTIPVTIITKVEDGESIEDFYFMVNTSGVKLNRPETLKAQYFETRFLKLVEEFNKSKSFINLEIIPASSQKRMMDRDLIEELCALTIFGITDKKIQVDKLYTSDISQTDETTCRVKFEKILSHLNRFNEIAPIKTTRYRQRNDFYTLFGFLKDNIDLKENVLDYFYSLLLILQKGIRPNSRTSPSALAEYAFNCVSQSNSATARSKRLEILNNLFLNKAISANEDQLSVEAFYPSKEPYYITLEGYYTFNEETLKTAILNKESQTL